IHHEKLTSQREELTSERDGIASQREERTLQHDDSDFVQPRRASRFWGSAREMPSAQSIESRVTSSIVDTGGVLPQMPRERVGWRRSTRVAASASAASSVATPPAIPAAEVSASTVSAPPDADLPLFESHHADDVPLITKPSPPRKPLSVRRA